MFEVHLGIESHIVRQTARVNYGYRHQGSAVFLALTHGCARMTFKVGESARLSPRTVAAQAVQCKK